VAAARRRDPARTSRLTLRGGVTLLVGAAALASAYILGWPELVILGCFAVALPLLAALFVLSFRPRWTVSRSSASVVVPLGSTAVLRASFVAGTGRRPAGVWQDRLPWPPGVTEESPLRLPRGGSTASLSYRITPPRRGIFEVGPLLVAVADPFGLTRRDLPLGPVQRLVVTPEAVPLAADVLALAPEGGSAHRFHQHAVVGDDDLMTRAYRPGDALRRVHWRSSARQGELMVRENELPNNAEALIVLDTRGSGYPDASRNRRPDGVESESFEWALRMTASLTEHLTNAGVPARVIETAPPQLPPLSRHAEFREGLAAIRLSFAGEGLSWLSQLDYRSPAGTVLFAIAAGLDDATARRLAELGPSCDRAVAFLVDATDSVAERLGRAGWSCIPVHPDTPIATAWQALDG